MINLHIWIYMKPFCLLLLVAVTLASTIHQRSDTPPGPELAYQNSYPVRLTWVNRSPYWYGDNIAKAWGVPGFAPPHIYNHIVLTFWSCNSAPKDMVLMWKDAAQFFGGESSFGKSTAQIQSNIRATMNRAGIKIMVSAFGDSEMPTSGGSDPVVCGRKLGQFVLQNNLDGADVDWQDNEAMNKGQGESWLIAFTQTLRSVIPNHIVTHSPQAPYFKNEWYPNQGYIAVHNAVGSLINFYNVQFYNQDDSRYDTYEELFVHATGSVFNGTALMEIVSRGIPARMLVAGKPCLPSDASNTGYVEKGALAGILRRAYDELGWYAGSAYWEYISDKEGESIGVIETYLKEQCERELKCN